MNAIAMTSGGMHELSRLFPNHVCVREIAVVALDYLRGLKLNQFPLVTAMLLVFQEHEVTLCQTISVWPARCRA